MRNLGVKFERYLSKKTWNLNLRVYNGGGKYVCYAVHPLSPFFAPLSHFPNSDTHFFSFHLGVRGDSGWVGGLGVIAWESQREGSQSVIVLELRAWFPLPLFPLYRRVG